VTVYLNFPFQRRSNLDATKSDLKPRTLSPGAKQEKTLAEMEEQCAT